MLFASFSLCVDVAAATHAAGDLRVVNQAHADTQENTQHNKHTSAAGKDMTLKRTAFDGLGPVPQHMQVDPELDFLEGQSWDPSIWNELWERRTREIQRQVDALDRQRKHATAKQNATMQVVREGTRTGSAERSAAAGDRSLQGSSSCMAEYTTWKDAAYQGVMLSNPQFWRYQTQLQFVLSNGLALELAVAKCANRFKLLQNFRSGKGGPIDIQNVWKAMCTDECLQSDVLHEDAMKFTGCTCLELSTPDDQPSYRVPGDWCSQNSARMLCDKLGFCGVWGCDVDDFMCPRYEWNKKTIAYKGPGHCDRKASAASSAYAFSVYLPAVTLLVTTLVLFGV